MAISSFSGLASGVQWRDLVDQLIAAQSAPVDRLGAQQKALEARKSAWASDNCRELGSIAARSRTRNADSSKPASALASGNAASASASASGWPVCSAARARISASGHSV